MEHCIHSKVLRLVPKKSRAGVGVGHRGDSMWVMHREESTEGRARPLGFWQQPECPPRRQRPTFQGQMEHILTAAHVCLSGAQVFVHTTGALTVEAPPHT